MKTDRLRNRGKQRLIDQFLKGDQSHRLQGSVESYKLYEKTVGIIDRADIARGRKKVFSSSVNSTLNSRINLHAILSTKKI